MQSQEQIASTQKMKEAMERRETEAAKVYTGNIAKNAVAVNSSYSATDQAKMTSGSGIRSGRDAQISQSSNTHPTRPA